MNEVVMVLVRCHRPIPAEDHPAGEGLIRREVERNEILTLPALDGVRCPGQSALIRQLTLERHVQSLEISSVLPGRLEPDLLELPRNVLRSQLDTPRADATTFQLVAGEIVDVRLKTPLQPRRARAR